MGSKNSSKTRVAPVFDWLLASDPLGESWVDALIALGSRDEVVSSIPSGQRLVTRHGRRWGPNEVALPAPQSLLEHLAQHLDPGLVEASHDIGDVLVNRRALAAQDAATIAKALDALRRGKRGRQWFVLEGESKPDAILETEQLVICIEGKRTESSCTTRTTWMRCRSQLVRHMDAALDSFPGKRILGLLIVEGQGGREATRASTFWQAQSSVQYSPAIINGSLPHRGAAERMAIANSIVGVTTWQAVCDAFDIAWPPASESS